MKFSVLFLSLLVSFSTFARGHHHNGQGNNRPQPAPRYEESAPQPDLSVSPGGDQKLVQAIQSHHNVRFLEAADLKVSRLLPDDRSGLPHQKFMVITSSKAQVLCVYNLDKGQRIPLKEGDVVSIGGEFKWTSSGPLMHWLHEDSEDRRPDGYVELAGRRYGLN